MAQQTVTIYKVEVTRAYSIHECGTGFCLQPWDGDSDYYEGDDDGGEEYLLPEGHMVAEGGDGCLHIYDADGRAVPLAGKTHPAIETMHGLRRLAIG